MSPTHSGGDGGVGVPACAPAPYFGACTRNVEEFAPARIGLECRGGNSVGQDRTTEMTRILQALRGA